VSGEEVKDVVTFTFDDGPNPATTPAVLDALAAYDVPGSFYIVTRKLLGTAAQPARDLIARIKREGYELASHSVNHPVLVGKKPARLAAEIDESVKTLAAVAEMPIGLFRAPYGAMNKVTRAWFTKRGLTEVFWSIDTRDWEAKNAKRLRESVGATILKQRGGIVLMHDIHPITATVLPQILDDLEAENCRRLAAKDAAKPPIIPVSIHYFLRDQKQPRALPDAVQARTARYTAALPARCAKRPSATPTPD
jgi:peptidoglycan/xylan/chitin deacetylase (PgdA/CDA1 family)